ncbi:MAG: ParB/RepB/Spo0J family partition protein [Desulfuromonadaceae bacterium]|nr:ParB/RepB/Spo0J family partition protein [Desulfuromonadaceae bacterium]
MDHKPLTHENYVPDQLYQIPLNQLQPDPDQPRKHFSEEALEELTKTILEHGILQPVLFTCLSDGHLRLISGERRYRAALRAGLMHIPAIYKQQASHAIALIENIVRENLSPIEEAEAIQKLIDEKVCSQKDLPQKLGKAKSTISEILSLNRLPEDIKAECRTNNRIPRGILIEVAKKRKPSTMRTLYNRYKEKGLTRGEVRKVARKPQDRSAAQDIEQAIAQLNRKIERIYERGFTTHEEQEQIESTLNELKKGIELRLKKGRKGPHESSQNLDLLF